MTTQKKAAAPSRSTNARAAESRDEKGVIPWRDRELTFERDANLWPMDLLYALRSNTLIDIIEGIFGPEQAVSLRDDGATRGDLLKLYEEWGELMGFPAVGE